MTEDKLMSDKESLELITSMINKAKNRFSENGFLYLLWGWVILICCLAQFSLLYFFNNNDAYYIWYLTWIAVVIYLFYLNKKKKNRVIRTYTDEINGFVWLVFIICTALLVFILIKAGAVNYINPAILVMYGMPTFLSGIILKFRPLIIGGILCWLLSLSSLLTGYDFQLLLIGFAVIVAWLIPGYLLKKKYKKEN
jgi:hypothetical protein